MTAGRTDTDLTRVTAITKTIESPSLALAFLYVAQPIVRGGMYMEDSPFVTPSE